MWALGSSWRQHGRRVALSLLLGVALGLLLGHALAASVRTLAARLFHSRLRYFSFLGWGIMAETYADQTLQEHASRRNLGRRWHLT